MGVSDYEYCVSCQRIVPKGQWLCTICDDIPVGIFIKRLMAINANLKGTLEQIHYNVTENRGKHDPVDCLDLIKVVASKAIKEST